MSQTEGKRGWAGIAVLVMGVVAVGAILWLMLRGPAAAPADLAAVATVGLASAAPAGGAGGPAPVPGVPAEPVAGIVTGSGSGPGLTMRGWPGQWVAFALPEGWAAAPGGPDEVALLHYPVAGQQTPYVKTDLRRGVGLSGLPADDWPTGTTTSTLQVAGRPALRYVLPPETSDVNGLVGCQTVVAVLGPGGGGPGAGAAAEPEALELSIATYVTGVAAEADCVPLLAAADGVIQTIELLEDATKSTAWTQTTAAAPGIPGPRRYTLSHPAGWTVRERVDRVELDGTLGDPSSGGAVHIEAVPRQPEAYYDAAQALLGAPPGLRWVGSQVTGGRRTSEYALNDLEPTRWLVTGPDLPEDSPEGRALDQAVWRILLNSSFTYAGAPGYP